MVAPERELPRTVHRGGVRAVPRLEYSMYVESSLNTVAIHTSLTGYVNVLIIVK